MGHEPPFHYINNESLRKYIAFKSYAYIYEQLYETKTVHRERDKEKAFRIRYDIYCAEYGFEDAKKFSQELEKDSFDDTAQQVLLIHKPSGEAVGTARVIPPNARKLTDSFPLQEAFSCPQLSSQYNLQRMGEISRLCVLKDFRGKASLKGKTGLNPLDAIYGKFASKLIKFGPMGLIRSTFEMSVDRKLDHACAVMETRLIRSLERLGILCDRIGPVLDYHGKRQPVIIDLQGSLCNIRARQKSLWEMMSYNGELQSRLDIVRHHNDIIAHGLT
jgi:N-acyl amino acid synthase of PEP-CTERM/exosortase system